MEEAEEGVEKEKKAKKDKKDKTDKTDKKEKLQKKEKKEKKDKEKKRARKAETDDEDLEAQAKKKQRKRGKKARAVDDDAVLEDFDPIPSGSTTAPVEAAKPKICQWKVWAAASERAAVAEVPIFANADAALRRLPERFKELEEAEFPEAESDERRCALKAIARLVLSMKEKEDLNHFLRSLQVAVVDRHRNEQGNPETDGPEIRPQPSYQRRESEKPIPLPRRAVSSRENDIIQLHEQAKQKRLAAAKSASEKSEKDKDVSAPSPPATGTASPPKAPKAASSSTEDQLLKLLEIPKSSAASPPQEPPEEPVYTWTPPKPDPKADREAEAKVYDICAEMQTNRQVFVDGKVDTKNIRHFATEILAVATRPAHWDTAWSQMCLADEHQRAEVGKILVSELLELAVSEVKAKKEKTVEKVAQAIADLSKGHRIKMKLVEEVLAREFRKGAEVRQVLSWLLIHWFPIGKGAGWGWWRVGWSWVEWWKLAERLLSKASEAGTSEQAFEIIKTSLEVFEDRGGGSRVFRSLPWNPQRVQLLSAKLRSYLDLQLSGDSSTDEKVEDAFRRKLWPVNLLPSKID